VCGDPGQVNTATVQFDDEQHVQPGQTNLSPPSGKSQARMPWAWLRRNCAHVGPPRRGAGPRWRRRRMLRTEVADTQMPSLRHSPTMRRYPHAGSLAPGAAPGRSPPDPTPDTEATGRSTAVRPARGANAATSKA
jgi:hypothetical protein